MNVQEYMQNLGQNARAASRQVAAATSGTKNAALLAIADALNDTRELLIAENEKDLQQISFFENSSTL